MMEESMVQREVGKSNIIFHSCLDWSLGDQGSFIGSSPVQARQCGRIRHEEWSETVVV